MGKKKDNFYVLLGLDPSVSDKKVIEDKINEMEKKWRNLVNRTGKPEYKRLLDRVPEIKECLENPVTREAEAKAALFAYALDPSKFDSAKEALPENYTKIEEFLQHNEFKDIYEFLGCDPASGDKSGKYGTADAAESLTKRSEGLIESFRILPNVPNAVEKMQLASLVADLFGKGYKKAYDEYILLAIKKQLCGDVDKMADAFKVLGNQFDNATLEKIATGYIRSYFLKNEIDSFIRNYCEYMEYKIVSTSNNKQPEKTNPPPESPFESNKEKKEKDKNPFDEDFEKKPISDDRATRGTLAGISGILGLYNLLNRKDRKVGHGIIQLSLTVITLLSRGLFPLFWISLAWGVIEGFSIYSSGKSLNIKPIDERLNRFGLWCIEKKGTAIKVGGGVAAASFFLPFLFTGGNDADRQQQIAPTAGIVQPTTTPGTTSINTPSPTPPPTPRPTPTPIPTPAPRIGAFRNAQTLVVNGSASMPIGFGNTADIDFYRFTLNEPSAVWLSLEFSSTNEESDSNEPTVELRLFNEPSDNSIIFSATANGMATGYSRTLYLAAGEYFIQTVPMNAWNLDKSDTYSLKIHAELNNRGGIESNIIKEHAVPLTIGEAAVGDAINQQDSNFFRLIMDESGILSVRLDVLNNSEEYLFVLYANDGRTLPMGHSRVMPLYNSSILPAGIYYIEVVNKVFSDDKGVFTNNHTTYGYNLQTSFTNESAIVGFSDTSENAAVILVGMPITGNNNGLSDTVFYTFNVQETGAVKLLFEFDNADVWRNRFELFILTEDTQTIMYQASVPGSLLTAPTPNIYLSSGNYFVKFLLPEDPNARFYTFTVEFEPNEHVEIEPNDTFDTATPTLLDEIMRGIMNRRGDVDFFMFTLEEKGEVVIDFNSYSQRFNITLICKDESILWQAERIEDYETPVLFLDEGIYYLRVSNNGEANVNYSFSALFTPNENIVLWQNNSTDTAVTLVFEEEYRGMLLTPQSTNYFRFILPESSVVHFDFIQNATSSLNVHYIIGITNGDLQEFYSLPIQSRQPTSRSNDVFLDAGTYYLRISPGIAWDSGVYAITVFFEADSNIELEPNDTIETATPVKVNTNIRGLMNNRGDVDFFVITIEEKGEFSIKFDGYSQNCNLVLFSENEETELWRTEGITTYESRVLFLDEGDYYLRISNNGDINVAYSFVAQFLPNGNISLRSNDSIENAMPILYETEYRGMLPTGQSSNYFMFTVTEPGVINFDFTQGFSNNPNLSYELSIINGDLTQFYSLPIQGRQLDYSSGDIFLNIGTYYLRILPGRVWNPEIFTLTMFFEADANIELEPNDTIETATSVAFNTNIRGMINRQADVDFFVVTIEEKGEFSINFDGQSQPFNLAFSSESEESEIWRADGVTASSSPVFFLEEGMYYLRVSSNGDINAAYSFMARFAIVENIALNQNNTFDNALPIVFEEVYRGMLQTSESVNYFRFTLPEHGVVHFDFTHSISGNTGVYYEIDITNRNTAEFYSISIQGNQLVNRSRDVFLAAGTYYVRVSSGRSWSSNLYALSMFFEADSNIELEPNDTFKTATPVAINTNIRGMINNRNDIDLFVFDVPANGELTVTFEYEMVNISRELHVFELYNETDGEAFWRGSVMGGRQTSWSSQIIGLGEGTYFLRITNPMWSQSAYTLNLAYAENENIIPKPNNDPEYAAELKFNAPLRSSLLSPNDVDYFKLVLSETRVFNINVSIEGGSGTTSPFTIEIITEDGATALTRQIPSGGTSFSLQADAGTYLLRIGAREWVQLVYTLEVN